MECWEKTTVEFRFEVFRRESLNGPPCTPAFIQQSFVALIFSLLFRGQHSSSKRCCSLQIFFYLLQQGCQGAVIFVKNFTGSVIFFFFEKGADLIFWFCSFLFIVRAGVLLLWQCFEALRNIDISSWDWITLKCDRLENGFLISSPELDFTPEITNSM